MAEAFLQLPFGDRHEVLSVAAHQSGRPAHLFDSKYLITLPADLGEQLG